PLESGIEIIARPPSKKLQTLSLLSGGEQTLTATALLFAIYMVKPSPFCVLDELDAPLDESNIVRFVKMMKTFLDQSQFVCITHNRQTISQAHILYGVTMEEAGISKIVSMKFTDLEPKAEGTSPMAVTTESAEEGTPEAAESAEPASTEAAEPLDTSTAENTAPSVTDKPG
ncbi:MAG: chromosome segregation protein SMC, partial [Lentisphaerae bacterium]|nr:chromosome segregation protein SMC [Lentisphaerota bacterium]